MIFAIVNGKSSSKISYKLLINDEEALPIITIIATNKSYLCKVEEADITNLAREFEISTSKYTEKLLKILQESSSSIDIINNKINIYKDANVKYFTKCVKETNHEQALQESLQYLFQQNKELSAGNTTLKQQNEQLETDLQVAREKCNEIVETSSQNEDTLLSCFVSLLNEKKQYIQHLQNFIDSKDLDQASTSFRSKQNKHKPETISESEATDEYNTDDEAIIKPKPRNLDTSKECDLQILHTDSDSNENFVTALPARKRSLSEEFEPQGTTNISKKLMMESDDDLNEDILNDTPIKTVSTLDLIDNI